MRTRRRVGGAADEASYSRLTGITANNVGKLGLAWSLDLPDEVTLEATGMPQFAWLTDVQIRQLHAYLRARARESLGLRKPDTPGATPPAAARPANAKGPVTY